MSSPRIPLLVVSLASTVDHLTIVYRFRNIVVFPCRIFIVRACAYQYINKYIPTPRAHFYYHIIIVCYSPHMWMWEIFSSYFILFLLRFSVFILIVLFVCLLFLALLLRFFPSSSQSNGFLSDSFEKCFGFIRLRNLWNETKILKFDERAQSKERISTKEKKIKNGWNSISEVSLEFHETKTCSVWFILDDWFSRRRRKNFDYNKQFVCVRFVNSAFFCRFVHSKANLNLSSGRKQWMPVQLIKPKIYCIISVSWEVGKSGEKKIEEKQTEREWILKQNYRIINVWNAIDFSLLLLKRMNE